MLHFRAPPPRKTQVTRPKSDVRANLTPKPETPRRVLYRGFNHLKRAPSMDSAKVEHRNAIAKNPWNHTRNSDSFYARW